MPGDDGLTLLIDSCAAAGHKDLPILCSPRNEDTDRILGLEMGADDYVVKPVCGPRTAGAYQNYPASFSYYAA